MGGAVGGEVHGDVGAVERRGIDPTGAGDTFAGGFMGHIAHTKDISFENLKTAIIVGSAMASFCVEKFGPERLKEINKLEIDDRIRQFIDLVNFDISLV